MARALVFMMSSVVVACGGNPLPALPGQAAVIATVQSIPGHDSICQVGPSLMTMGDPASDTLDTDATHDANGGFVGVQCFIEADRLSFSTSISAGVNASISVAGSVQPRRRDANGVPTHDDDRFPNIAVTVTDGAVSLQQSDCYAQYVDLTGNPLPREADAIPTTDGTFTANAWFSVFCNDAQNIGASNPNVLVCQTAATIRFADCQP